MEWVTSPAFGNKRKRILFAHTEENSCSPPHERARAPRGQTHTCSPSLLGRTLAARLRSAVGHGVQDLEGRGLGRGSCQG